MSNKPNDLSYQCLTRVLDGLDALVYVSDMDTYELLYMNEYGRNIWGDYKGKTCWQVLQDGQTSPCEFCTNHKLRDENGESLGVYVWEFQNTQNQHWYQCRDQAITWVDGRTVRMEIATDITDRKQFEEDLIQARLKAESLAHKDELTGLNNRRAFFEKGQQVFKQASRYQHAVSVIMMDIDHFKNINDNFGHAAGDEVLCAVAQYVADSVREIDIVARIGGEEFAFVLPETDMEKARNLAERLRLNIKDANIIVNDKPHHVTASFGVATGPVKSNSLDQLLTKADDALYIAKKKGRDQVKCYS